VSYIRLVIAVRNHSGPCTVNKQSRDSATVVLWSNQTAVTWINKVSCDKQSFMKLILNTVNLFEQGK